LGWLFCCLSPASHGRQSVSQCSWLYRELNTLGMRDRITYAHETSASELLLCLGSNQVDDSQQTLSDSVVTSQKVMTVLRSEDRYFPSFDVQIDLYRILDLSGLSFVSQQTRDGRRSSVMVPSY